MNARMATTWGLMLALTFVNGIRGQDGAPIETVPTEPYAGDRDAQDSQQLYDFARWKDFPDYPVTYFQSEVTWMQRNQPGTRVLGSLQSANGQVIISSVNTDRLNFDFEPSARFLIGQQIRPNTFIEASYFGLNTWYAVAPNTVPANANQNGQIDQRVNSPFLSFNIVAGSQTYEYDSTYHNLEINMRRLLTADTKKSVSLITGLRYFNLEESFDVQNASFFVLGANGQATGELGDERQRAQVYNNLLALQVGGEFNRYFGPIAANAHATAGLGPNFIKSGVGHFLLRDGVLSGIDSAGYFSNTEVSFAGVFNLGFGYAYQITRGIAMRCGYDMFFVTSQAFATDQLQPLAVANNGALTFTNFGSSNDGFYFMHGFTFGGEFTW